MIQYKCSQYEVGFPTINHHINQIFNDNELEKKSTIRNFRIVQKEGNRSVSREVAHYNLHQFDFDKLLEESKKFDKNN